MKTLIAGLFPLIFLGGCVQLISPQITLIKSKYQNQEELNREASYQCNERYGFNAVQIRADSFDTVKYECR